MGFPFPHYDAEFLLGVVVICVIAAIVWPVSRLLPESAGTFLAAIPLVLLVGWCAWMWYRVRRG